MNKVDQELRDKLTEILASGISSGTVESLKKKVREITDQIESDLDWAIKDDLAPNLSAWVCDLAGRAVESLLAGNEAMMRRYLACEKDGRWTGRNEDRFTPEPIERTHQVIHGVLFEQGFIKLRRDIVDAHRDLLVSERVLDLEDQVASLVAQVNKANVTIEDLRGRR